MNQFFAADSVAPHAVELLNLLPADRRADLLLAALSFQADGEHEKFALAGPVRAAFALYWEQSDGAPTPFHLMREPLTADVGAFRESVTQYLPMDVRALAEIFEIICRDVRVRMEVWQRYKQQMQRLSCPGCGEDTCGF